jgi:hypothetical protein
MAYQANGYGQQQQQDVVPGEQYRYALTNFVRPILLHSLDRGL